MTNRDPATQPRPIATLVAGRGRQSDRDPATPPIGRGRGSHPLSSSTSHLGEAKCDPYGGPVKSSQPRRIPDRCSQTFLSPTFECPGADALESRFHAQTGRSSGTSRLPKTPDSRGFFSWFSGQRGHRLPNFRPALP